MDTPIEIVDIWYTRLWRWFIAHAQGRHALPWLAAFSFADAIFFPISAEIFLVALVLAHPSRWRQYLPVAIISNVLGAIVGYFIATFLFYQFGESIIQAYELAIPFAYAQGVIYGHVFIAMFLVSLTPIPDKVFIYAGGFLGVHLLPFITGYAIGRSIRMSLVVYFTERFGKRALSMMSKYFKSIIVILIVIIPYYFLVR